jgi:hypothetical protein
MLAVWVKELGENKAGFSAMFSHLARLYSDGEEQGE